MESHRGQAFASPADLRGLGVLAPPGSLLTPAGRACPEGHRPSRVGLALAELQKWCLQDQEQRVRLPKEEGHRAPVIRPVGDPGLPASPWWTALAGFEAQSLINSRTSDLSPVGRAWNPKKKSRHLTCLAPEEPLRMDLILTEMAEIVEGDFHTRSALTRPPQRGENHFPYLQHLCKKDKTRTKVKVKN